MNSEGQPRQDGSDGLTVLLQILGIPVFLVVLWAGMNWFADINNVVVNGTVTARQETIVFGGDEWHRAFQISYRYQLKDSGYETESSFVDEGTFERLASGARVVIHYSPWRPMRLIQGVGCFIDGAPWASRLPGGPWQSRDWGEAAGVLGGLLVGWFAYRRRSIKVGICAALLFGAAYPLFLLLAGALLAFPFLFWAWRKHPRHGYGVMLLGGIAITIVLTYWRVPHPDPLPTGPSQTSTATVRQVKLVRRIWSSGRNAPNRGGSVGQNLDHPFYMVDLEFTPPGESDPVHAVDKIDETSGTAVSRGQTVPIVYAIANPRKAQMISATRNFDEMIFRELILQTSIGCLLITLVGIPLFNFWNRLWRKLFPFANPNSDGRERFESLDPRKRIEAFAATLSPDDPRRVKLEAMMKQQNERAPHGR